MGLPWDFGVSDCEVTASRELAGPREVGSVSPLGARDAAMTTMSTSGSSGSIGRSEGRSGCRVDGGSGASAPGGVEPLWI